MKKNEDELTKIQEQFTENLRASQSRERLEKVINVFLGLSVLLFLFLAMYFIVEAILLRSDYYASDYFCEGQGYDGVSVLGIYSKYYGEVICYAGIGGKYTEQNFSVHKNYLGYLEK